MSFSDGKFPNVMSDDIKASQMSMGHMLYMAIDVIIILSLLKLTVETLGRVYLRLP